MSAGYTEPLVARATGIKKYRFVAERRKILTKGEDWSMVGGVVTYTEAGLIKICAAMGLDRALVEVEKKSPRAARAPGERAQGAGGPPASANEAAAALVAKEAEKLAKKNGPIEIELTRTQLPNTMIVLGKRIDTGAAVTVKVRSNKNFIPGLVVKATPVNGHSFFHMVGRPPRWRGDRFGFTRTTQTEDTL